MLAGRRAKLDAGHPSVLEGMINLAVCYQARGRFDAAEPLYKAALAHINKHTDKRKAWEDVHWALLNSKEFLFRH